MQGWCTFNVIWNNTPKISRSELSKHHGVQLLTFSFALIQSGQKKRLIGVQEPLGWSLHH